jgi:alcohol dehydrogenase class IV
MNYKVLLPPNIEFGIGKRKLLIEKILDFGKRILLVTGRSSFLETPYWEEIEKSFKTSQINFELVQIRKEPTPELIDEAVRSFNDYYPDVIIAIGGGSVLDAGKAISAMLTVGAPVINYLEGVGDGRTHPGTKIPFFALPTTSGTGSEATKNAVISHVGENGFKKSLRHDNFIPDLALIDPELTIHCPENISTWSGMDAFTQLLESYLSTAASPLTDAIAISGLEMINKFLEPVVEDGTDLEARSGMAYAAFCSGITLANAGLGIVHGFASSIGGRIDIPHGLVCASLMGVSNEITLNMLLKEDPDNQGVLKYAEIGKMFHGSSDRDNMFYAEFLINKIYDLTLKFKLPKLREFGLEPDLIPGILENTSNKNNPTKLLEVDMKEILVKTM